MADAENAHALISASKMARIMRCPGSVALEAGIPDTPSDYAEEGTRAHELAAAWLLGDFEVMDRLSDAESIEHVGVYVGYVNQQSVYRGHELLVEQRVDYSDVIGVPDSFGTADAIILAGDTLIICDLKYGMGVRVDAEENEQLQMYALGALDLYGLVHDFKTVKLVIIQPRLNHISEWETTPRDLRAFADEASSAAKQAMSLMDRAVVWETDLSPGEKQCKFCKAKAICPALSAHVQETIGAEFENLDEAAMNAPAEMGGNHLGVSLAAVPLIEDWCKAVRAKAEAELLAGKTVPGFKLVQGRSGHRKWSDEAAAAKLLRQQFGAKGAYDISLISPAAAEKRLKADPKGWGKLEALISKKPGPPSVAPESDKRPAYSPADDFENLDNKETA